jgi:hypothetical protein
LCNQQKAVRDEAMNTVVIEHVTLDELPAAWRAQLHFEHNTRVTVRIEEEAENVTPPALSDNPLFGMWQDRSETADVQAFARELRATRYNIDSSRRGK